MDYEAKDNIIVSKSYSFALEIIIMRSYEF